MKSVGSTQGQGVNILELFLAIIAVGFSVSMLIFMCHDYDENLLVRQAQLPEGPASALFDFEETYFNEPFLVSGERSDNTEHISCSMSYLQNFKKDSVSKDGQLQIHGELRKGESLDVCLKRYNIDTNTRYKLVKTLAKAFNVRRCRPGERFDISLDQNGNVLSLNWYKGPFNEYKVVADENGSYTISRSPITVENRIVKVSGQFTGGLYDSFANYGLNSKVARQFSEIFSSSLDFNADIRVGDSFSIIFSKYYRNGEYVGTGRIVAAKYCSIGGSCLEAYYFSDGASTSGYYKPDGTSVSSSFLRSPLKVYKITSRFTTRRFHPVLKVYRPHYGVDLAAPIGTPIVAVADGTVTFTGWQRGYGRIVVLKHRGGYKTYYGHLHRFAKGIKKGAKVHQKQVIGYVGRSGYATGPHLDFRVWHNGKFVDPLRVKIASSGELSGVNFLNFLEQYKQLEVLLRDDISPGIISVKKETIDKKPKDLTG